MVDTIAELASLSKTLNKKSDSLNATIISINEKLRNLNFGMSVVLDVPIEYDGTKYYLGYGKHYVFLENKDNGGQVTRSLNGEEWQLSIYNERIGQDDALLGAPREVRIHALDLVPNLLDLMKAKAEELIGSIERAEKLAENL